MHRGQPAQRQGNQTAHLDEAENGMSPLKDNKMPDRIQPSEPVDVSSSPGNQTLHVNAVDDEAENRMSPLNDKKIPDPQPNDGPTPSDGNQMVRLDVVDEAENGMSPLKDKMPVPQPKEQVGIINHVEPMPSDGGQVRHLDVMDEAENGMSPLKDKMPDAQPKEQVGILNHVEPMPSEGGQVRHLDVMDEAENGMSPLKDKMPYPQPKERVGVFNHVEPIPSEGGQVRHLDVMDEAENGMSPASKRKKLVRWSIVDKKENGMSPLHDDKMSHHLSQPEENEQQQVDGINSLVARIHALEQTIKLDQEQRIHTLEQSIKLDQEQMPLIQERSERDVPVRMPSRIARIQERSERDGPVRMPSRLGMSSFRDCDSDADSADSTSEMFEYYTSKFNEDTFSFIIVSKPWSQPFLTGLLIFALKTSIFLLVLANVIDWNTKFNKLGIPVNVNSTVVISQFFAFGITVFTQDDLITVMVLLYEGYRDVNRSIEQVSYTQWAFAVSLALLDALLGLFATFVLIVNSSTVLEVLLNFAAVEFVSQLDNTTFELSTKGFTGRMNQLEAFKIQELEFTIFRRRVGTTACIRKAGMALVLLAVGVSWLVVYTSQVRGLYAIGSIHVQFDDSTRPGLASHNGFYNIDTVVHILPGQTRFLYEEERESGKGRFAFCRRNSRWAFLEGGGDPCSKSGIEAQASKTGTFQLTDTASKPWFAVRPETFDRIEMPEYQLTWGCQTDVDCGPDDASICIRHRCECSKDYTGYQCDYRTSDLCDRLEIDASTADSFSAQRNLPTVFHRVKETQAYDRLVYRSQGQTSDDLLLFTGLRWAIIRGNDEGFGTNANNMTEVIELIGSNAFHSSMIKSIDMMSERVWFSTTSDKFMDARGLQWYNVQGKGGQEDASLAPNPVSAVLICAICNNSTNRCQNDNVCNSSGLCECQHGESGPLCQIPPKGDGKCDRFFNNAEYSFDGGDCCRPTCRSKDYECGSILDINGTVLQVGYPFCKDPTVVSTESMNQRQYQIRSTPIRPHSSKDVSPILSANGRILILAEPAFDTVRVYDRQTNHWELRSVPLEGVLRTRFGESVDIATVPGTVLRRRQGLLPMVLAISSGGDLPSVQVFEWRQGGTSWTELPRIDLKTFGLCFVDCNVTVGAGATPQVDRTTDYFIVVNVAEVNRKTNCLFKATSGDVTNTTQWQMTTLAKSDLVSVTSNGRYIMLFDKNRNHGTLFSVEENRGGPGAIVYPEQFRDQPNVTIEVEAMQVSASGEYLGCIFKLSNESTTKSFIQHYRLHFQRESQISLNAELEIDFPFDVAEFSTEGEASAAVLTERNVSSGKGKDIFRVLQLDQVNAKFELLGEAETEDINLQQAVPTHASISYDGVSLAFGGKGQTEELSRRNLCPANEVTFRFVFRTDSDPDVVSWNISTIKTLYGSVVTDKMIHRCSNCYLDESFARSVVTEKYCVPRKARRCLRFGFVDGNPPLEPNAFYNAFLIEPEHETDTLDSANVTLGERTVARGRDGDASKVVVLNDTECEEQPPSVVCSENEQEFLVRFLLDNFPEDIEWELRSGADLLNRGNFTSIDARERVWVGPRCLPENTCYNFTVVDKVGDGLCCESGSGYGEYVGFFGRREAFRGGVFKSSESNLFGSC